MFDDLTKPDSFITKEPKIALEQIELGEQTRRKIERLLQEQTMGHVIRASGLKPRYRALFHGAAGTGKAQPLYSKILTPSGWVSMGDIKIKDVVLTPSGNTGIVTNIFPQGKKAIVKITLEDNRVVECCEDHLWKVSRKKSNDAPFKITTAKTLLHSKKKAWIPVCKLDNNPIAQSSWTKSLLDEILKDKKKITTFSTISKELSSDLQKLCWSLGLICKIKKTKNYYRLFIKDASKIKIKKIEKTKEEVEMQCISIDHPEHLYITDNYVVTHNTIAAEAIAHHLNKQLHIFNLETISANDPDEATKTVMDAFRYINTSSDVFLFDEFDAIASSRSADGTISTAARRTSNALLIAFEQITSHAILICATNFISTVDPAFRRRFDTICKFVLPSIDERETIIRGTLKKYRMHAPDDDIYQAAKGTEGLSFHEAEELTLCAIKTALLQKKNSVNLIPEIPGALERRNTFKQTHDV
jgi:ATPase family associated with various cellular activities (AAA)